jgi:hypothetical protein
MPALRQLGPDLWVADTRMRNGPFAFAVRMCVIRLRDRGLVLHSPIRLEPGLRAELARLGEVRAVIAPNLHHHLFAADYPTGYPEALLFAAPGLAEKRSDLKFAEELGDESPALWRAELEQHLFRGAPFVNEVVFFHPASRTVLFTDLVFNLTHGDGNVATRVFFGLLGAVGHFGPHRMMRLFIRDRVAARESVARILRRDFERVTMTHGEVLETGGREAVRKAFEYLG